MIRRFDLEKDRHHSPGGGGGAGGGRGGGRGQGRGGGQGQGRGSGQGGGRGRAGTGADECVCPQCGTTAPHQRGVPCTNQNCPKCGGPMTRR